MIADDSHFLFFIYLDFHNFSKLFLLPSLLRFFLYPTSITYESTIAFTSASLVNFKFQPPQIHLLDRQAPLNTYCTSYCPRSTVLTYLRGTIF